MVVSRSNTFRRVASDSAVKIGWGSVTLPATECPVSLDHERVDAGDPVGEEPLGDGETRSILGRVDGDGDLRVDRILSPAALPAGLDR